MAKIKVTVIQESAEHADWQKKVDSIEATDPESRTDEQWEELAALNESEPVRGDKERVYYVPTFDSSPATTLQKLPKHLFQKDEGKNVSRAMEFTQSYLGLFMPRKDVSTLTISQINEIGAMLNPTGERLASSELS